MNDLIQARPLLQEELKRLIAEENVIDAELSQYFGMIAGAKSKQLKSNLSFESLDIASSVQKLEKVGPTFEAMQQDSKKMAAQVEDCRALSERLSSMVRRLDTMQIRAQQTLACTEDIMNLKECKTKILIAIEERNLAAAVSYLRQVHEIDIIAAKSSDDYEIIKEKEQIIKNMVQEEFSNAIGSSNIKSVMSLCPLLQTLGLESVARDTFLDFVEKTVFIAISADASSVEGSTDPATAYAKSLSSVFNSAYIIIQQYLPMVIQGMENSLGDVHFIRRLHKRCEQEAGMVLKRYMKFRRIREVMGAIKASNSSTSTTSTGGSSTKLLATPAEMHTIMDELALMIQYCCKYAKYIKHICKGAEQKQRGTHRHSTTTPATSTTSSKSTDNINATTSTTITAVATDVVVVFAGATEFDKMIDELLNKYYMEGEQWLMRIGVQQALSGAIIPGGIATSEIKNENIHLDECFFLLQKCGLRAIATNNIHAACAVLHLIADLISSDLLNQANQMLNITITQLHLIMNDHINKYKRSMTNNDEESTTNDSTSSVSAGFKNALSLASTLTNNNTNNNITSGGIKLEEEGGFSLTGNPNSTITDPWGVANSIETFNILELCVRYTERLNRDISNAAMNVFASSDQENTQNTGTNASTTATGTTTVRNNKSTAVAAAGASESDKVRLCREDFEAAKISFSNALRQGADKIVSSAKGLMKDIFTITIGRQAPLGGIRFDESDQNFDQQPSLSLLPRILCLPIETLINISSHNLSERNRDMIVGMLADTCCERLEHFITQTTFRFAGALKMEEIVRTLSSLFSRYSSVPIRGRFSRLREIMLILTSDTTTNSNLISENFTQLNSNEVEAFLILRLDLLNTSSSK